MFPRFSFTGVSQYRVYNILGVWIKYGVYAVLVCYVYVCLYVVPIVCVIGVGFRNIWLRNTVVRIVYYVCVLRRWAFGSCIICDGCIVCIVLFVCLRCSRLAGVNTRVTYACFKSRNSPTISSDCGVLKSVQ